MSVESQQSDAELLHAVRGGNAAAYGRLYERHVAAARALARQLVHGEAEVEDVVAESFTKILDLVGRGGGPDTAFRTYLLTVVRRTVHDRSRVQIHQVTTGEIELFDPGVPFTDPAMAGLEGSLIAKAYLSLPERWRAVLWHTEVESASPADVAPLLGLSANGVAALAYRAREGLRQAYLQTHLTASPPHDCKPVLGKLGAYVRGGLTRRDAKSVDEHVSGCPSCHAVLRELTEVNRSLRAVVGPLILGTSAAGYATAMAAPGGVGGGLLRALGEGGLLRALGWARRMPGQQQLIVAGGAATVLAVAAAFALVSAEEPDPVTQSSGAVDASPLPAPHQPPSRALPTAHPERVPAREPAVPPAHQRAGQGRPGLRATIAAMGSLIRAQPGIVAVRLRNAGDGASEAVYAAVELPPGVTLVPPGRRPGGIAPITSDRRTAGGSGTQFASGRRAGGRGVDPIQPVGIVDGWTCRPAGTGARCARRPLAAGRGTAVFLRVQVAAGAPLGPGPTLRVEAGPIRLQATAASGVRPTGASARFAADGKVTVRAVGNSFLSCPAEREDCAEATRRRGDQRDNDLWPMRPLDQDRADSTAISSGARLALPEGGRVVWAGLYWSASAEAAGPIKLRPPGRKRYVAIRPSHVASRDLPTGPAYQAFADVTGLVSNVRRQGTWWAADAPLDTATSFLEQDTPPGAGVPGDGPHMPAGATVPGDLAGAGGRRDGAGTLSAAVLGHGSVVPAVARRPDRRARTLTSAGSSGHAGWSLVVVATDPRGPYGQAVVLDTAAVIGGGTGLVRIPLGGLEPAAAPARAELVTWEGDADLRGDKVSLGSGPLVPAGGDRDPANVFDGSSNGVAGMTFGVDVDTVSARLGARPSLAIAAEQDVVLFGVAAVSVRARP
ncbi:sigma-70 family RNA polymerase sigma factor [Nonomuraea sp. LPB2021202275-12-8]|uniref:sigma-70 family RNA polymerase sigma factor n=1 Tax=Nonomuraea sp. LPB2021202275-12-8 TaxID=3120159 RepID=UPI00300C36C5